MNGHKRKDAIIKCALAIYESDIIESEHEEGLRS